MTALPYTAGAPVVAPGMPVVEALGIRKQLGSTAALKDARIRVMPGESHALVGRNGAGKSTLVSILTGLRAPDAGSVLFGGQPAPAIDDRDAWRERVACVYQHSTIIRDLSVAENLFINRQPRHRGLIDWARMMADARRLLSDWGLDVRADLPARELTVEARQLVEIARALSYGARFIILDEPTAQLDGEEIRRLFRHIRALQQAGVTFLFISHHLEEVYQICQTVTVMRDAQHIVTAPVGELPRERLIEAMTGEAGVLVAAAREQGRTPSLQETPELVLRDLGGADFSQVSLDLRAGEIVGLTGATSSGRTGLAEVVAGLQPPSAGRIERSGRAVFAGDVPSALQAGIACVPKDRHREGLVLGQSVAENATMTVMDRLGRLGWVRPARKDDIALRMMDSLGIVASGPAQVVGGLSGGNQQKVVMARALASEPRVLVLIDPTAGVDVKSKEALLQGVVRLREEGKAVLVSSGEIDDLRVCDRVLVMHRGSVAAEFTAGWTDNEVIAAIEGVSEHEQ